MAENRDDRLLMSAVRRLGSMRYHLARRILFLWIKPNILDCQPEALSLAQEDAVCYVLPYRSLTDLMVIDEACQRAGIQRPYLPILHPVTGNVLEERAVFFLARPEGLMGRKSLRRFSERMQRLLNHQNDPQLTERPIKIVPVSIFWGQQPDKERSLFKTMLSENWNVTSRFKKFMAGLFHPRHILVQFNKPIVLSELIASTEDEKIRSRKLSRLLRVHFRRQKQAILGPDLSHRRTLIHTLISSSGVMQAVREESDKNDISLPQAEQRANAYAREIVSHQTFGVIRFFYILLSWLWNRLYDGINLKGIDQVKELARDHEIVYIPCHRSHIDYLLLSYVLYVNGLTPPHIAAGKNLNLPIAGALLRRAGAFFMRRSFRGDPLYTAVFDEYMHLMLNRGYAMEYFIEGGRSRTGRTLNPRTGMLSITLNSLKRESSLPIAMLPVYFGYERILEGATYMNELSGAEKKEESLMDIVRVFKMLKGHFGQVSVNFGEAVILQDHARENGLDWSSADSQKDNKFREVTHSLAQKLATHINAAVAITPVNLVATIILATPKQTIEEYRLLSQLQLLNQILRLVPLSDYASISDTPFAQMITHAEKVCGLQRTTHDFGDILSASPQASILLTYYRNNCAHVFAMPSLVARCIRQNTVSTHAEVIYICSTLYPYLKAELFLPWEKEDIPLLCRQILEALKRLGLIIENEEDALSSTSPATEACAQLTDLAEIIEPSLERYFLASSLLQAGSETTLEKTEKAATAVAARLSAIYGISSPEFFDTSLFKTFLQRLQKENCISLADDQLIIHDHLQGLLAALEGLLDTDIIYNALQAIHQLNSGIRHPAEA